MNRRGFTMLTTVWIMTIASVGAMAAALAGRLSVDAARNRVELERGYWRAEGCARRAQAAMDAALTAAATPEGATSIWRTLDRAIAGSSFLPGCDLVLEAVGTRLDLNSATDEMIANLAIAVGHEEEEARDMADALLDWRDADDSSRSRGAEREWYAQAGRVQPRNAPLADVRELPRVRGFEDFARFDSLVSVEPGRVSLATAPVTVLLSIPGITPEIATAIVERQRAGNPIEDLSEALTGVSEASAAILTSRYSDAVRMTTPDPDAWLLRSRARSGIPANTYVLQWRIGRVGRRVVVLRARGA